MTTVLCRRCRYFVRTRVWTDKVIEPRCSHLAAAIPHSDGFLPSREMRNGSESASGLCGGEARLFEPIPKVEQESWGNRHANLIGCAVLLFVFVLGLLAGRFL